jgi:hypothetical protein
VVGHVTWRGRRGKGGDGGDEERGGEGRGVREFTEDRINRAPHFDGVSVGIDDVFQVRGERRAVDGGARAGLAYALGDVEDDTGEAIFVEVDFLVVWYLADCTVGVSGWLRGEGGGGRT